MRSVSAPKDDEALWTRLVRRAGTIPPLFARINAHQKTSQIGLLKMSDKFHSHYYCRRGWNRRRRGSSRTQLFCTSA